MFNFLYAILTEEVVLAPVEESPIVIQEEAPISS
jgi:hypothetical protein